LFIVTLASFDNTVRVLCLTSIGDGYSVSPEESQGGREGRRKKGELRKEKGGGKREKGMRNADCPEPVGPTTGRAGRIQIAEWRKRGVVGRAIDTGSASTRIRVK
jgi:hypothetical protein